LYNFIPILLKHTNVKEQNINTVLMKIWIQVMRYHSITILMSLLHKEDRWQKILKSWVQGGVKESQHQIGEWLFMLGNQWVSGEFLSLILFFDKLCYLFVTFSSSLIFFFWHRPTGVSIIDGQLFSLNSLISKFLEKFVLMNLHLGLYWLIESWDILTLFFFLETQ